MRLGRGGGERGGGEGLVEGYAEVAESAEDAEKSGWDAGGVLGCCLCFDCMEGMRKKLLSAWDPAKHQLIQTHT